MSNFREEGETMKGLQICGFTWDEEGFTHECCGDEGHSEPHRCLMCDQESPVENELYPETEQPK